jgi:hypothetical protein
MSILLVCLNVLIAGGQTQLTAEHARTRAFNIALGVECTHCHVQDQWTEQSKPAFSTAANMVRMVDAVNQKLEGIGRVSCITCHGGEARPSRQPRERLDPELARWPADLAGAPEGLKLTMVVYNIALGVDCGHCHSSDWKARDKAAIKKVPVMNALFDLFPKYMPSGARTQCYMCHKGSTKPKGSG